MPFVIITFRANGFEKMRIRLPRITVCVLAAGLPPDLTTTICALFGFSLTSTPIPYPHPSIPLPPPQSSVYSLAFKSIISFSTIVLLGLIIAYHCCEVQVEHLFGCCVTFCAPPGGETSLPFF